MPDIDELFERLERVEAIASDFREWRSGIMVEHGMLKDGVANFRTFQTRGTKFFDRFEAIADSDERRKKRNATIAIVIGPFILAVAGWGCAKVVQAGITIYQIEEQWKEAHPSEFKQQKSLYDSPERVYATDRAPQDAQLPPMRR